MSWPPEPIEPMLRFMNKRNLEVAAKSTSKDADGNLLINAASGTTHQSVAGGDEYSTPNFLREHFGRAAYPSFEAYVRSTERGSGDPTASNYRERVTIAVATDFILRGLLHDGVEVLLRRYEALEQVAARPDNRAAAWRFASNLESRLTAESTPRPSVSNLLAARKNAKWDKEIEEENKAAKKKGGKEGSSNPGKKGQGKGGAASKADG